jgi:hypothetical protein
MWVKPHMRQQANVAPGLQVAVAQVAVVVLGKG